MSVSSPSSPRKDADGQACGRADASIVQQLNLPAEREGGKERERKGVSRTSDSEKIERRSAGGCLEAAEAAGCSSSTDQWWWERPSRLWGGVAVQRPRAGRTHTLPWDGTSLEAE